MVSTPQQASPVRTKLKRRAADRLPWQPTFPGLSVLVVPPRQRLEPATASKAVGTPACSAAGVKL